MNNYRLIPQILTLAAMLAVGHSSLSQELTLSRAVALADSLNGNIRAASVGVEASKRSEAGSMDFAQPQLQFQAPTGNFYTAGVQQNFEYPGVYAARRKVARAKTGVAESELKLSKAETKYEVTLAYLNVVLASERQTLSERRALLFTQLSETARRRFAAGDIGQMEKSFAEMKAAEAMRMLRDRQSDMMVAMEELYRLTGIRESESFDSLRVGLVPANGSTAITASPWLQLAAEKSDLAKQELKLSKRQQLPGFYAAFMNQGERNSPVENRFGFGISIPLWFWQVNANVRAASLREQQADLEYEWIARSIASEFQSATLRLSACQDRVSSMLTSDIPLMQSISKDAVRTFEAGEISMMEYLRIVNDTLSVMEDYLRALHEHEQAQNQINFITSIP